MGEPARTCLLSLKITIMTEFNDIKHHIYAYIIGIYVYNMYIYNICVNIEKNTINITEKILNSLELRIKHQITAPLPSPRFWQRWVCCCVRAFSSCGERGPLFCCGARASHCGGFSRCRAQALGTWASVVVARGLSSCGSRALERRLSSCGARA